jgi:hypothetical protein
MCCTPARIVKKMKDWIKSKIKEAFETYQAALDVGDQKLANKAMKDHENYTEMLKMENKT